MPEHRSKDEAHRATAELHETRSVARVCHEEACRECSQRGVNQLYRVCGVAFDGSVALALHGLDKLLLGSPATEFTATSCVAHNLLDSPDDSSGPDG
jgi:hypothetical protein